METGNFIPDPWTGHLHVIIIGPATVDVKTQPVVVLKMGVTVPKENFFEANVVGNLASLLGIDPANIQVTFQMRASVGILSRNVKIVGNIYTDLRTTAWSPCAGYARRCNSGQLLQLQKKAIAGNASQKLTLRQT